MRQKTIPNSLILLLTTALLLSCEESTGPDNGEDPKPPGYQEEIPWHSLADSPWPIYHGNPQGNGRTRAIGPQLGAIEADVKTEAEIGYSMVLGPDSTIYFASPELDTSKAGLYAYNQNGVLKWKVISNTSSGTSPLISNNGTIYYSTDYRLFSVNPEGGVNWKYDFGEGNMVVLNGLNITKEGNIIFITSNREIRAINPDGKLVWSLKDESLSNGGNNSIFLSPDGKTLYTKGKETAVIAVSTKSQVIKWNFGDLVNGIFSTPPIIDSYGNVYVNSATDSLNEGKSTIYCLTPNGKVKWFIDREEIELGWLPTIDKNGNLYFQNEKNEKLYKVDFDGNIIWTKSVGNSQFDLVCDGENNIYTSTSGGNNLIYAITQKGEIIWQLNGEIFSNPAVGYNKLFVPLDKTTNFYIIK